MNLTNVVSLPVKSDVTLTAYQRVKAVVESSAIVLDVAGAGDTALGVVLMDTVAGGTADIVLLNAGGVNYAIASAAIAVGVKVQSAAAGKIVTATTGQPVGVTLKAASGNGSIIRVIYFPETADSATPATAIAALGNVNGAFAGLNSTAVNPTKTDFDALLAQCELLADDFRSLVTALVARGEISVSA